MKIICEISQDNPELAVAEIGAVMRPKASMQSERLLIIDSGENGLDRLSYCHQVLEYLFDAADAELGQAISAFDWSKVCGKGFYVSKQGIVSMTERELAGIIWRALPLKMQRVDRDCHIRFIRSADRVHVGKLIWLNTHEYMKRKAHLRPALHPTSLHPKLARACVNLLGISKGTVCDPFCGSGGFLIEAGLMGFSCVGMDIEHKMLERCMINLEHYGIKAKLTLADALALPSRYRYIVTDLPYGRNTARPSDGLYGKFLRRLYENRIKRAVVMFPHYSLYRKDIEQSGLEIEQEFSQYIHKSLTKKILVLRTR